MKNFTQIKEIFSALVFTFLAVFGATSSFAAEPVVGASIEVAQVEFLSPVVNINTASAEELAEVLSGVGSKKAEQIVAFRQLNGQFAEGVEITAVKGIGQATFEKNKNRISVD